MTIMELLNHIQAELEAVDHGYILLDATVHIPHPSADAELEWTISARDGSSTAAKVLKVTTDEGYRILEWDIADSIDAAFVAAFRVVDRHGLRASQFLQKSSTDDIPF